MRRWRAFAVLSGPSFALEAARGEPTAVVVAGHPVLEFTRVAGRHYMPILRAKHRPNLPGRDFVCTQTTMYSAWSWPEP